MSGSRGSVKSGAEIRNSIPSDSLKITNNLVFQSTFLAEIYIH